MELIFLPDEVRQSSGNTTFFALSDDCSNYSQNSFFENRIRRRKAPESASFVASLLAKRNLHLRARKT